MISSRIVIVMLLAAAVFLLAPNDPVLLRRTWTIGESTDYMTETKMVQSVEMPGGMGEQEITYFNKSKSTYKVASSDVGGFTIDITTDTLETKMESGMGMPMPEMPKMPPMTIQSRSDIMNRFQGGKGPGFDLSAMFSSGTAFLFPRFPSHAVKVGDSWSMSSVDGVKPKKADEDIVYTFAESAEHEGVSAHRIDFKGRIPLNIDPSQMGQDTGGIPMEIKGFTTGEGSVWIEKATGKTLTVDLKMGSEMTTSASGFDIQINGKGTTTMKITK